jgi:LysM repeat protein
MTMYSQQQSPPPSRNRVALIGGALAIFLAAAGAAVLIMTRPQQNEDLAPVPTDEQAAAVFPTASPAQLEQPAEPSTPTVEATWTPQPPYEHPVQENETLLFILQLYGYRTLDVVPAVLALNGLPSEDYIQVGQVLKIPRQTPTPSPSPDPNQPTSPPSASEEGVEPVVGEASTAEFSIGATSPPGSVQGGDSGNRVTSSDGRFWVHTVQEGENIASIARSYDSSVPCILQNNGFQYDADRQPIIFVGQQINVCIVVTLTPTPSPTGDPFNSTATPTPTLSPPLLLAPANEKSFGRNEDVTLQWVATYPLTGDQRYLVIAQDLTNNRDFRATTTKNAFKLPTDLRPGIGQTLNFEWRIVILQGDTTESPMVSGLGEPRQFTWGG